jgi:hypothetical protein
MRRSVSLCFVVSCLCSACSAPARPDPEPHYADTTHDDPSDEIFAMHNLVRFDLEVSAESRQRLRDEPLEYVRARFRYRGQTLEDVGVRLKGEGSFRDFDDKPAFKLKFDEFRDDQRFMGLKRMALNNQVRDPSALSQPLAYAVFRSAGLPAPRCNSALVYVNGEYYGLYANVEVEDKVFLERWFDSNDGNLYEETGVDLVAGAADEFELETNEAQDDRADLEALIDALERATPDDFLEVVGQQLDMDHYLSFAALGLLLGGEDSYPYWLGNPNNFRLYRDPARARFVFLPWGLDRALRPRFDPGVVHAWIPALDHYHSLWDTQSVVQSGCLQSPSCRASFVARVREMTELFEQLDLASRAHELTRLVEDAVLADTRKPFDDEYAQYARELLAEYVEGRPEATRAELRESEGANPR